MYFLTNVKKDFQHKIKMWLLCWNFNMGPASWMSNMLG